MGIAQFIHEYGYLAIALGSFLEGEAVLLAGSLAAYYGHLELALVLPLAALASFLGDMPYFFAGRRYGESVLLRFPRLRRGRESVEKILARHHVPLVLALRFLYGLRMAGLVTLGMSRMSVVRFLWLDFIGAVIWASAVCAAGIGVGSMVQVLFEGLGEGEQVSVLFALLVGSSALIMLGRRWLAPARLDQHR